jgi:hypothetical protein
MSDFFRHMALRAKAKSGFSPALVGWLFFAAVSLALGFAFLSVAAYVWLASRFDGVIAGLVLGAALLVAAGIFALAAWFTRLRTRERAQLALATEQPAGLLDPRMLGVALEIGRTLGWRRIATLAAAGVVAAGLGREWSARGAKKDQAESKSE